MKRYPSFMERLAPGLFWGTVSLVLVAAAILLLVVGGPGALIMAVVFVFIVGCVLGLMVWRAMRLTRQRAFLLMLAESIERRIPLIPALQAFGTEYGNWRGRTRRLATALANGIALPEALRLFPGLIPPEGLPLIEAGHQTGRLGEAMRRAAEQNDRTSPIWQSLAGKIFYLAALIAFMCGIWTFIALWIVPKYMAIFADFDCQLPWITQIVIGTSDFVYEFWYVFSLGKLVLIALLIYGALCYLGLITCDLPLARWIVRRLDTATILDTLALATEAGQPMPDMLTTLAGHYPKRSVRRRLRNVWFKVADGRDWCDSLASARLLRAADAGVLRSAARAGNLAWAMRQVADSNRRRFAYRMLAMLQIVFPVTLGLIGLVVCLYVTACFMPLIQLIERLC